MQHLSRHITLHCDYFGYFRSQKYLPRFRNLTAIFVVFGHFKMSSSQGWPRVQLRCVIYYTKMYTSVDNLIFF